MSEKITTSIDLKPSSLANENLVIRREIYRTIA
jgi:hypothetical protein